MFFKFLIRKVYCERRIFKFLVRRRPLVAVVIITLVKEEARWHCIKSDHREKVRDKWMDFYPRGHCHVQCENESQQWDILTYQCSYLKHFLNTGCYPQPDHNCSCVVVAQLIALWSEFRWAICLSTLITSCSFHSTSSTNQINSWKVLVDEVPGRPDAIPILSGFMHLFDSRFVFTIMYGVVLWCSSFHSPIKLHILGTILE